MAETIKGQNELNKYMKKMSNPQKFFDEDVKKTARQGLRYIKIETLGKGKIKTGNTSRAWGKNPFRRGLSQYYITNKATNGNFNIVRILDEGHGVIRPKKSKRLYIPLTPKGASKRRGSKIPKSFIFGIDYVLAKKARAVKGKNFISKTKSKTEKGLIKLMLTRIARS